jgi:hypothetical protein
MCSRVAISTKGRRKSLLVTIKFREMGGLKKAGGKKRKRRQA